MRKDYSVTTDALGNIIVAGPTSVDGSTSFVAKLDKEGHLLWHETLSHGDVFSSAASSVPPPAPERDSVEPQIFDTEIDAYQRRLGRQGRLARWIGGALAFAGLFAFGLVGGALARQATSPGVVSFAHHGVDEAVEIRTNRAMSAVDMSAIGASVPAATVPMAAFDVDVDVQADEITVDPMSAVEDFAPVSEVEQVLVDGYEENVIELQSAVLALLNTGQFDEAVTVGRRFVEADPKNAFTYLCLGAALQDTGRAREARETYDACARNAERGDISECMALGGRK